MPPRLTPIDEQTYDASAQMLKALLPYMDTSAAKPMAIIAKFLEIKRIIIFFNNAHFRKTYQQPPPEELLKELKKYCDDAHSKTIDMLLNVFQMGKIYNNPIMKEFFKSAMAESSESKGDRPSMDMNDVLNSDMFKNVDMNKFNQLLSSFQNSNTAPNVDQLKSMLSPEQKKMFDSLSQSLSQNK